MAKRYSTATFMRRLNAFEASTRTHEMKGTYHPNDWSDIEEDFAKRKKLLIEYYVETLLAFAENEK